jgi:hypothetical protein
VYLWISEQLGREPRDVRTPDAWWDRWISQTRVVLPRGFLLAGRNRAVTEIRDALGQAPRPITVVGPSREEALAIVCASLLGDGDDDEVDELPARAVIVSAPGAWDRLVDSDNPIVLIPSFGETAELNVFQVEGNTEADRQTPIFGRGRIDHLGLQAASIDAFDQIRDRLIARGASDHFVTDFGLVLSVFFRDPDGLEGEVCAQNPDAVPGVHNPPGTPAARYASKR